MKQTDISTIGEFGLIDRISKIIDEQAGSQPLRQNLLIGIADDAAVYKPAAGKVQLFTTDAFVEGIHFDLTYTSFKHLGWKAIVANVSDIAAMCGVPRYATIVLSLPKKISVEMIEEFYHGAVFACEKYSCLIVGGDTTSSLANSMISVAMTGEADESKIKFRKNASPGEYICVTGHLGASLAGLKILKREKERFALSTEQQLFKPNLEPYTPAIEKHLMPKPRLDISGIFAERVNVGAIIDVSDGLASEINHICNNSGTGAVIHEHNIPVDTITQKIASEFNEPPTDYALYGGEEYELLFTIKDDEYARLEKLTNDVTIIGRVTEKEKGIVLIRENGEQEPLKAGGWNHFKS
ncbi:MAG: thiamine-phosphate kinase [Ignavibacteriales bacterium]|nr:thiamine-phosphate kinase [Ignavibacteriales bacterium]